MFYILFEAMLKELFFRLSICNSLYGQSTLTDSFLCGVWHVGAAIYPYRTLSSLVSRALVYLR